MFSSNQYIEWQLIPFHPHAVFDVDPHKSSNNNNRNTSSPSARAPPTDPADFTARSPYPTFHLLLESEVSKALEVWRSLGKSTSRDIIERNKRRLRDMGSDSVQHLFVDEIFKQ